MAPQSWALSSTPAQPEVGAGVGGLGSVQRVENTPSSQTSPGQHLLRVVVSPQFRALSPTPAQARVGGTNRVGSIVGSKIGNRPGPSCVGSKLPRVPGIVGSTMPPGSVVGSGSIVGSGSNVGSSIAEPPEFLISSVSTPSLSFFDLSFSLDFDFDLDFDLDLLLSLDLSVLL